METQGKLPEYLTIQQASEESGLAPGLILAALKRGEMPSVRAGKGQGGTYHVRRTALAAWLQAKESRSTDGTPG
jgi:excisionase family DNA binding protein